MRTGATAAVLLSSRRALLRQPFEHRIRWIAIAFDVNLRPEFVGKVAQRPAGGDRNEEGRRLLVAGQFGDGHRVRDEVEGAARVEGPTMMVPPRMLRPRRTSTREIRTGRRTPPLVLSASMVRSWRLNSWLRGSRSPTSSATERG